MNKGILLASIFCSIALSAQSSDSVTAGKADTQLKGIERVIPWFPADTETVAVSKGPFGFPGKVEANETKGTVIYSKDLASSFEGLPLGPVWFKDGLLAKRLEGKTIEFAVEGSRHFRSPTSLGEMPYEGCSIISFVDNLRNEMGSFSKDSQHLVWHEEQIESQQVSVFQDKFEQDTWTLFVTFPNEHLVLLATNRDYLAETLARMHGKGGPRALPSDLPEWNYVNTQARFWGLRHYDKNQSQFDPSSPYGGRKSANFPDEQAIGMTFVCDPERGKFATLTYLSKNFGVGLNPTSTPLGMAHSSEAKGLDAKYRELSPGVVQASYSLEARQPLSFFIFVLEDILGHGIYL